MITLYLNFVTLISEYFGSDLEIIDVRNVLKTGLAHALRYIVERQIFTSLHQLLIDHPEIIGHYFDPLVSNNQSGKHFFQIIQEVGLVV